MTVESSGVSLTKSVVTESEVPCFEYRISSERQDRVKFHIEDRLPIRSSPESLDAEHNGPRSPLTIDATWWLPPNEEIEFRREFSNLGKNRGMVDNELSIEIVPRFTVDTIRDDHRVKQFTWGDEMENGESPESDTGRDDETVVAALPAYNEGGSIKDIVSETRRYVDAVLVVDDGSDDETSARAWEAGAFVHRHDVNSGYGAALQTIFTKCLEVDADHLVILDSDGQHDAADIPRLIRKQRSTNADIVIANRFGEDADTDMPQYRWLGLSVINFLTNLGLGSRGSSLNITDSQSGFRAYNQKSIRSLVQDEKIGERMEISTDILYHAKLQGYDVAEVDSTIEYDVEGASNINPVMHGYMLVKNLLPMIERERPLVFLGIPGFVVTTVGLGIGILLYSQDILASDAGLLAFVLTLSITLTGLFACTAGIMLHTLHRFHAYSD